MKPEDAIECGGVCSESCPYIREYWHPVFFHTAWCLHLNQDLFFYDGFQAECLTSEPNNEYKWLKERGKY